MNYKSLKSSMYFKFISVIDTAIKNDQNPLQILNLIAHC